MDTTASYRKIIERVIEDYAKLKPSHGNIRLDAVFDEKHDRYALMQAGWDRGRRVRGNLIYVVIENGKVIIEYDGMESGITPDLIEGGILETDIVHAFIPDSERRSIA